MYKIHAIIATGFGLGHLPWAPGTYGSLLALGIAFFFFNANVFLLIGVSVLVLGLGTWSSTVVENKSGETDPSCIVVDEMVGMWIGLIGVPLHWKYYLISFLFFRFFDIVKSFPANRMQNIAGGWGVMLDDVVAGAYTLLLVQLLMEIWPGF